MLQVANLPTFYGVREFESHPIRQTGSSSKGRTKHFDCFNACSIQADPTIADMMELVDRADLESVEICSRVGSSPTIRTNIERSFNG